MQGEEDNYVKRFVVLVGKFEVAKDKFGRESRFIWLLIDAILKTEMTALVIIITSRTTPWQLKIVCSWTRQARQKSLKHTSQAHY